MHEPLSVHFENLWTATSSTGAWVTVVAALLVSQLLVALMASSYIWSVSLELWAVLALLDSQLGILFAPASLTLSNIVSLWHLTRTRNNIVIC